MYHWDLGFSSIKLKVEQMYYTKRQYKAHPAEIQTVKSASIGVDT